MIAWDESLAKSETEIWQLVSENDIFVIVDSAFALTNGLEGSENGIQLGDVLVLHNIIIWLLKRKLL